MKGCYNHPPYRESYPAQDGYYPSEPGMPPARIQRMVEVPHRMTTGCQYTLDPLVGMHDEKCKGCVWRKPEMVRA